MEGFGKHYWEWGQGKPKPKPNQILQSGMRSKDTKACSGKGQCNG